MAIEINDEKLNQAKQEAEAFYKQIDKVGCPYLQQDVAFNARGLEHIKFKARHQARSAADQYTRLRVLKLVPKVIKKSHTLQELWETQKFEELRTGGRREKRLVKVIYYGFVAVVNEYARIRVIVKRVENGDPFFWSVIPYWKHGDRSGGYKKIFHSGDLETD